MKTSDDFKVDRWDRDLTHRCHKHGQWTDKFGDCPICLMDDPHLEERMKTKRSFADKNRDYENKTLRDYLASKDKPEDPQGTTEEEYLSWRDKQKMDQMEDDYLFGGKISEFCKNPSK